MSWLWLAILVTAGVALWLRRRLLLRRDAELQESLDHLGAHAEPKQPPAKQPWRRPGFGPSYNPDEADLGTGPVPPPAGVGELGEDAPTVPAEDSDGTPEPGADDAMESAAMPPPPPPPEPTDPADVTADAGGDLAAAMRGPQVLDLPPELEAEVRSLMADKQEVAAVRLVCDSMDAGILDAQRTVRALVGR